MLATISIDMIDDGQRLRDISEAQVATLVNSIGDIGLLNPITVFPKKVLRGASWVDGYGLIAGLHRKTACERLGLAEIEAQVLELSDLERQIAECDENLCSTVLSASERARFTKRRKEAYEAIHGKAKGIGAAAANEAMGNDFDATAKSAVAFTDDTAARTGASARTVRLDAERGEKVSDEALSIVKGTELDTGTYLDKLKAVPKDEQAKTVREQLRALREKPADNANKIKLDADIRQRAARACADLIAEYLPPDAWDHFKSNLAVTTSKDLLTEFTNITGQSIMDRTAA
jgi:ParB family chromosome partitioning protein